MNFKRLFKALGFTAAIVLAVQIVFHGGFWLLLKIPEPFRYFVLCAFLLSIGTVCFYKALKIKESFDD